MQERPLEQRVQAEPLAPILPQAEEPEEEDAADDQERHERETEWRDVFAPDRGRVQRLHPAPGAALEDPENDQTQSHCGQGSTHDVELRRVFGSWRGLHLLPHEEDDDYDHDLTDEDESPGVVRGHPAADDRSDRDGGPGNTADDPVRKRPILPLVVGSGQGGYRGDDQHRSQPFDERPAHEQDAEVRAQRGRQ